MSGWQQVTISASDHASLACAYILPDASPPSGGFPGVILFHGLGQSYADMEPIGAALAQFGFAALACDARGTGASQGKWGLDGPRETQDAQDLFTWFAGNPTVSNTQIGAFGLSLGGGAVWNATVAGVPFKAIVPAITWTNLATALNPSGVPKTGLLGILSQVVPISNWDPTLIQTAQDLLQGNVTSAVTSTEATRSSRSQLHALTVPTLLLQGRHDFLFDMDQAIAAWKLLAGPKRLYLGDLGHPPATTVRKEVGPSAPMARREGGSPTSPATSHEPVRCEGRARTTVTDSQGGFEHQCATRIEHVPAWHPSPARSSSFRWG